MALADYLQPRERVAAESGHVAVTNLRLIHHIPRSGAPVFRELPLAAVHALRLSQRPRITTVVLGALIAVLSLLAGPGTPLQLGAAGLGAVAAMLGIVFGDLSVVISAGAAEAKPHRWPLREASRREGKELVAVAQAAIRGEYDFMAEPAAPAPAPVARSVLLLPADDAAGALGALGGDADVICLDLTTLVHPSRKTAARGLVGSMVAAAARTRQRVWARVNLDEAEADLAACAWPGLTAVVAPAASAEDVNRLDALLSDLEDARDLTERVGMVVQIETAAGVLNLRETLGASPRVTAAIAATHDALDLLGRPDARSTWTMLRPPVLPEPAHLRGRIAAAAGEAGVPVYACLATGVAPGGLAEALGADAQQRLAEAAAAAVAHGYAGALTLHPEAAGACNAAFPGSAARGVAVQAAPLPSPWQPVVPSHFGIGVKAVAAPAAPTTAMPAARNAKRRVQPNVAPPASPSGPSAWQPVVPSHFGYRVAPREPDGGGAGVASPEESPTREES